MQMLQVMLHHHLKQSFHIQITKLIGFDSRFGRPISRPSMHEHLIIYILHTNLFHAFDSSAHTVLGKLT